MPSQISLKTPLDDDAAAALNAGDEVLISGPLIVARDQAHRRFIEALEQGLNLPFDPRGQMIYYMGPSPAPPGMVIGAAGPTTSGRMDPFTPALLAQGVKGLLGKGRRAPEVREALVRHRAVYLAAVGGLGALLSRRIVRVEPLAYPDLGPEAVLRLEVENFPATVINDIHGRDLYQERSGAS